MQSETIAVMPQPEPEYSGLLRLKKDLKLAAADLRDYQARFLVDTFYSIQNIRVRTDAQRRELEKAGEPHEIMLWLLANARAWERDIKNGLDRYSDKKAVGRWAKSIKGVAEVIAAGLMANINIEVAPTVGHIWSFCGLNPDAVWKKGERRPWNAGMRRLCWLIGESFVKVSSREGDVYGKIWRARKEQETQTNMAGGYVNRVAEAMSAKRITDKYTLRWMGGEIDPRVARWWLAQGYNISATPTIKLIESGAVPKGLATSMSEEEKPATEGLPEDVEIAETDEGGAAEGEQQLERVVTMKEAFEKLHPFTATIAPLKGQAMLAPGHIHARSKRYAVKRFLADYHLVAYWERYGALPAKPYVISVAGHAHYEEPPNIKQVPGLLDAWRQAYPFVQAG